MNNPSREPVGVVGAGNSACALACYLAGLGHPVHLFVRNHARAEALAREGALTAVGRVEGTFPLGSVTGDPGAFARRVTTVFVATVATAYRDVAARLAPHLHPEHRVVLFSSKLAGSVEFARSLRDHGAHTSHVLETDALFACRLREDGVVWVRGFKEWTLFSAPRRSQTERDGATLQRFFPGLDPATNVLQRGLTDFGALAHPTTMVANMNTIDRAQPFLFYREGFTERTVKVLEAVEDEFHRVARAYGATLLPMATLLKRYYGCDDSSLLQAMRTVPNYRHSQAPGTLDHRFLKEDVACTLVPLRALAHKAHVEVPMVDSLVRMACDLTGEDLVAHGRTLERLGWDGRSHAEIRHWIES